MLYVETVEPRALSLLRQLFTVPTLSSFSLVDGTALSLLYGHRKSIDLDLFSEEMFDNGAVLKTLATEFGNSLDNRSSMTQIGIFAFIDQIKVDLIRHPHPLIRKKQNPDGLRMFSAEDIIAMKVQAVLQRGKKKDFYDISELLNHFSVADFVQFHKEKYATQNLAITVPQAITYFADAEDDLDPIGLKGQTWNKVKASITAKVREFLG